MEMEGTEEVVGSTNSCSHVAKGKRTKRHRPSSSSSASADDHVSFNSSTTQEEQDMANCLILLAQGASDPPPTTKFNNALPLVDVYECKTCNRTFPSFQALGGHRASHKKPKLDDKKPQSPSPPPPQLPSFGLQDAGDAQFKITPPISLQLPTHNINKAKIHECSICGSEFTSGQALGGHMRRHRASTTTNAAAAVAVEVKPRNVLELDLNLPAPEDDLRDSKFHFTPTHKSMVLSAPALVDCHY